MASKKFEIELMDGRTTSAMGDYYAIGHGGALCIMELGEKYDERPVIAFGPTGWLSVYEEETDIA